jgi:hypothetical protein
MAGSVRPARPVVSRLELHSDEVAYLSEDAVSSNCGDVSPTGFKGYMRTRRKRRFRLNACSGRGNVFEVDDFTSQLAGRFHPLGCHQVGAQHPWN